jgi:hypothetical protein
MANLLEEASILLTPTAYNNGSMLAVKPSEDLLGPELVANGDFSTDSVWAKDANWSIANGKATSTGAGRMFQSIPFLETNIGSKVVVSFDIVDYTSGGVVIQCYGSSSETFTGVGTHTFETVTTNTLNFYINNSGQGNLVGSIDNVSVKVDLSGDFTFSRNSAATRVNAQGLVENVQILSSNLVSNGDFSQEGSELITNGDFATDSNWNKSGGWTISGGKANADGSSGNLTQTNVNYVGGNTYKLTFTVSDYVSGSALIRNGNVAFSSTQINANGNYEIFTVASGSYNSILFFNSGSLNASIDNVSVKEVGQDWILGTGVIVADNKLTKYDPSVGNTSASQSGVFTIGKTYKYKLVVSGDLTASDKVVSFFTDFTSAGTYEGYWTANSTSLVFSLRGSTNVYSIDSVSVKEITDDTNLPRIDYTDGCGSWLLEPQSTNLITNSEDFSNISWVKGRSIISSNATTSPSGDLNADKFIGSSVSGDKKLIDSISVVSGNKYTLSVFAKKGEFNGICLRHNTVAFPSGNVIFNLDTGLGTVSGVIDSFSSKDYGNGWWKLSITSTSDATNSCGQELLLVNDGAFVTNGNDVDGIYIWGAQSEQQSFPTSYIPTNGAASTRLRDLSGNSGNTGLINSTEGVLYFEGKMMENAPVSYVSISDGTGSVNNNLNIRFTPSTNTVWWRVQVGGSASVSIIVGLSDMFSNTKLALKWKENDFSLWENGNKISFDTLGSVFPLNTLNTIDLHEANGLSSFNSELKAIAVFKTALTDEQLTALTTI